MSSQNGKDMRSFYLDDFYVEPDAGQISKADLSRHVSPNAIAVLLFMAENYHQLVTREEIIETVWGTEHVGTEALTRAISEIRHALNDQATASRYIQTLHSRGYKLLVKPLSSPVDSADGTPTNPNEKSRLLGKLLRHGVIQAGAAYLIVGWVLIQVAEVTFSDIGLPEWTEQFVTFTVIGGFPIVLLLSWFLEFADGKLRLDVGKQHINLLQGLEQNYIAVFIAYVIASLGAATYQLTAGFETKAGPLIEAVAFDPLPISENSLAVLRLAQFGDDERLEPLAEGLSEDLIDAVAKLPGLLVSSRGDSWSLAPNSRSETIRERLRVSHYVEGSIRFLDAATFRVVVQLVDAKTGFHIVSRGFNLALKEYFAVPEKVTELLVSNLRLGLSYESIRPGSTIEQRADVNSYLLQRRGLHELYKPRTTTNIGKAIGFFNSALELDQDYPAAHAGICRANTLLYSITRAAKDIEKAQTACSKALATGARLPLVLNAVGNLYFATGNYKEARDAFQGALEYDKRYVQAMAGIAKIATREGDFDEAEQLIKQAIELSPGNWRLINNLAGLYFGNGMYEEAAGEYGKIVLIAPENFAAIGNLGAARLMSGDLRQAQLDLERSIALQLDPLVASNLGIVHYFLGDFERAVETFTDISIRSPKSSAVQVALADAVYFAKGAASARAAYERAQALSKAELVVNPEDSETLAFWAWSQAMNGQSAQALSAIAKAIALAPDDPYSHYYHALIAARNGDSKAANKALKAARGYGYPNALLLADPFLNEFGLSI